MAAKSAYVILNGSGAVVRAHKDGGGNPTTGAGDLKDLISTGYLAEREVALTAGGVLIVLKKP